MNSTVHVQSDRCDVWAPTQAPSRTLETVKNITGLAEEQIHVHTTNLGCGLGRRAMTDFEEETTLISKEIGRPVASCAEAAKLIRLPG